MNTHTTIKLAKYKSI